jgi:hypothetical protein
MAAFCALESAVQTNRPTVTPSAKATATATATATVIFGPLAHALKKNCIQKPLKK